MPSSETTTIILSTTLYDKVEDIRELVARIEDTLQELLKQEAALPPLCTTITETNNY
jgi:hypothetical protein